MEKIRLTQYSHGAGCGCKISPKNLDIILKSELVKKHDANLLVGYDSRDDAAVYDIGNNQAVISTTDFFMPIVDEAFDFGRIAATNAISDIYAMGGRPIMAIAVLGWPINKIPLEEAQRVVDGGRKVCNDAGIPLAGGHSIDSPEPIFGLAVTGIIEKNKIKRNDTAHAGDILFITKPLGIGILSTAQKKGFLSKEDEDKMIQTMCTLNKIGTTLADIEGVHAMTDVTGFGLLGHLKEMAEGSGLSARLDTSNIPLFENIHKYIEAGAIPGGTHRNWESYRDTVGEISDYWKNLLADPQTSGGLLLAVDPSSIQSIRTVMEMHDISFESIGNMVSQQEKRILIEGIRNKIPA
jgi:selenide, water dikinase